MKTLTFFVFFLFITSGYASSPANDGSEVDGWSAFSKLQTGNMRFYEGRAERPNQGVDRRTALSKGQKPHAIVLSCSDSRLPPELVFDQGLGDVFSVRLAGNIVTPEALASIEYAVDHLGPKFLLVLGHESCGAVGAALATKPGSSAGSPSLDKLVSQIRNNFSARSLASENSDPTFRQPVKENVASTMRDLLAKSAIVRKAVQSGGLVIGHGVYSLKTGKVDFWDVGAKFRALASSPPVEPGVAPASLDGPIVVDEKVTHEEIPPAHKH